MKSSCLRIIFATRDPKLINYSNIFFVSSLVKSVGCEGFEPATSALSRQHSKPTELTSQRKVDKAKLAGLLKYQKKFYFPLTIFAQMKKLRIIYMGTPDFAVPPLEKLIENNYDIAAVITAPDKPSGRGLKVQESAVKKLALKYQLPILQPTNLKSEAFIQNLELYQANLQIVVAFRMLPKAIWQMPEIGTFNLHASLLPQYRGAAPINWAIINGEKQTGLTSFFLKHAIDTGDILLQEKEPILPKDTAATLYKRLMIKGADLVLKTVQLIESGNYHPQKQPMEETLKKAPKIFKENCRIDFSKKTDRVYDFIRGLSPYPGAWTLLDGKQCKIYSAKKLSKVVSNYRKTTYVTDYKNFLYFNTKDGAITVEEIQMEAKKKMKIKDFLRGYNLK